MKFDKRFKISLKKIYSEPIYNEKYLKDKIKSCNAKTGTNFRNNKIAKEGSQFIGLLVILIDSVFRTEIYHLQVFLQERKYVVKEETIPKYIIDDIEISSDSDREISDEENSNEENSKEEISNEKKFYEEN